MSDSSNTTITHKEEKILQDLGYNILEDIAKLTNFTLFYGVFLVIFFISVHMILRRGLRNRASWAVFVGTFVNFGLETAKWILLLTHLIYEIQFFLIDNGDLSLKARIHLDDKNDNRLLNPVEDIDQIPLLISDAFVIWRAWALFANRRMLMSIPLILYCATVVTYIVGNSFNNRNEHLNDTLFLVNLCLSLSTNFITTLMIGFRLWVYRKHITPNLGINPNRRVQRTFTVLLESGAAYCILQLATLINYVRPYHNSNDSDSISDGQMQSILFSTAAMYPSIIAIITRTGTSRIDDVGALSSRKSTESKLAEIQASYSESSMPWIVPQNSSRPSNSLSYDHSTISDIKIEAV